MPVARVGHHQGGGKRRDAHAPQLLQLSLGEPVGPRRGRRVVTVAGHAQDDGGVAVGRDRAGRFRGIDRLPLRRHLERDVEAGMREQRPEEHAGRRIVADHETFELSQKRAPASRDRRGGRARLRARGRTNVAHALGRGGMSREEAGTLGVLAGQRLLTLERVKKGGQARPDPSPRGLPARCRADRRHAPGRGCRTPGPSRRPAAPVPPTMPPSTGLTAPRIPAGTPKSKANGVAAPARRAACRSSTCAISCPSTPASSSSLLRSASSPRVT